MPQKRRQAADYQDQGEGLKRQDRHRAHIGDREGRIAATDIAEDEGGAGLGCVLQGHHGAIEIEKGMADDGDLEED